MSLDAKPHFGSKTLSDVSFGSGLGALGRGEFRLPVSETGLLQPLREMVPETPGSRAKIWELHQTFHCSIIGTCLTTGDLKSLLLKLKLIPKGETSDHEVHKIAVTLAGMRGTGAKLLHKTLDRKFRPQIATFATARSADDVRAAWDHALEAGDIPGAYWAVMTHPATPEALVRHVFGEIHMLSHLVGAANRADIRRLRQLEADNADLLAKVERQQAALRDAVVERDRRIRELQDMLSAAVKSGEPARGGVAESNRNEALATILADTQNQLLRSARRVTHLENRIADLDQRAVAAQARAVDIETEAERLRDECQALEAQLGELIAPRHDGVDAVPAIDLDGATILYVGGRASQVPHLRALVERLNGLLIHHSGGTEESTASLPGFISRAQAVLFPVDCVSHTAMFELKRLCKQAGKPYLPLRTASIAALLAGLEGLHARLRSMVA
jgi:Uncharacterized protein conserved in bacteria (DUF2325)